MDNKVTYFDYVSDGGLHLVFQFLRLWFLPVILFHIPYMQLVRGIIIEEV